MRLFAQPGLVLAQPNWQEHVSDLPCSTKEIESDVRHFGHNPE